MLTKKIMRICESMIHDERIDDDSKEIISEYVEEITDALIDNSSQGRCADDDDDDDFIEDELSRMKRKYSNTKDVIDKLRDYLDDEDDDDDDDYFDD